MGFFFSENGCDVCPLSKQQLNTPCMKPTGSNKPILYFLGEAPGKTEDEMGRQFVGDSGKYLKNKLYRIIDEFEADEIIRWSNIVRCRPPGNRTPDKKEIEYCLPSVMQDIELTKPCIIVGFGLVPLKALIGGRQMKLWRGRFIPIKIGNHVCWYFPTYHPSFLLRRKGSYESEFEKVFARDLQVIYNFISNYKKPEYIESNEYYSGITTVMDLPSIEEQFKRFKDKKDIAIDIETDGLKGQDFSKRILSIAISDYYETFAFPYDHPEAWVGGDRDGILKTIKLMLDNFLSTRKDKVAHNLKFELEWFYRLFGDQKIIRLPNWQDTMAQAYLLDERTDKNEGMLNLDTLIRLNFGFNLKELSPDVDRKNILKTPLPNLLRYNALDAKYTFLLYKKQHPLNHYLHIYNDLVKTATTLAVTQSTGITPDMHEVRKYSKFYGIKLLKILKAIKVLPEIIMYEGMHNDDFNPLSPDQVIFILKELLGITSLKKTSTGKYSTDDEVLNKLAKEGVKLAQYVIDYRIFNKLKSTYVDNVRDLRINDVIYPNFNHLFTKTGRFSGGRE